MKKTTLAAGLVLLTIVLFIQTEEEHQLSFKTIKNTLFNSNSQTGQYDQGASEQLENIHTSDTENPNSLTDSEFSLWIKNEAANLDASVKNEKDTEFTIRQKAALLKPNQVEQLKSIILDSTKPINERIFSNYVLTVTFTTEAEKAMNEIILSTNSFSKAKPAAHSDQEIKRNQEYALRFTLIDENINRIKKNGQNPLDYLMQISEETYDPQIKMYALQKAKALSQK